MLLCTIQEGCSPASSTTILSEERGERLLPTSIESLSMSSNIPSSTEPDEHPIYYLGRVGQRAQMTRASTTGRPPVLPPPRILDPRPQLPPISKIPELQNIPTSPAHYVGTNPLPTSGLPYSPTSPRGHATASVPPAWPSPVQQPISRPSSSYSSHPALYPQRASFQSKNPGTVYEALSPVEYGFKGASSLFNEASYTNNPYPTGPVSTFESHKDSHTSPMASQNVPTSLEDSLYQPGYQQHMLPPSQVPRPDIPQLSNTMPDRYILTIRQQPLAARACGFGERDRRVIDPPPVVQLSLKDYDPTSKRDLAELKFPFNIVHCALLSVPPQNPHQSNRRPTSAPLLPTSAVPPDADVTATPDPQQHDRVSRKLMGNIFASPFVATDPDAPDSNLQQARKSTFFIFPDLSCRQNGRYRLRFTLMKVPMGAETPDGGQGSVYGSVDSDIFQVYSAKDFPGMTASSKLIRELKKQGAAVNVRKGKDRNNALKEAAKRGGGSVSGSADEDFEGEASVRKKRG